jgi:hypothetical protein
MRPRFDCPSAGLGHCPKVVQATSACVSLSPRMCIRSGDRRRLEIETDKVSRTLPARIAYLPCLSIHFGPGQRM